MAVSIHFAHIWYDNDMPQWRLILLLVTPSWLSFCVVTAVTVLVVGVSSWSYFTYNPTFYDFFYGEHGIVTTLELAPGAVEAVQENISNNPVIYGVGIVVSAMIAAAIMLFVLRGAERGAQAASHLGNDIDRRDYIQHVLLRLLLIVLWIVYALLSVNVLLPMCLLFTRIGAEDVTSPSGFGLAAASTFLFGMVLHGHIVFARMVCLRPRVFGSEAAIEDAIIH